MPWGIVRLSRRRGIAGFARSLIQAAFLVSVRVTRGGGLKVVGAVIWPLCLLWPITLVKTDERATRPLLCLRAANSTPFADEVSVCAIGALSNKPLRMAPSENWSSG